MDDQYEYGTKYIYRVESSLDGKRTILFETDPVIVPSLAFELHQNYPNPFNPVTKLSFTIPERAFTNLSIYNVEGKLLNVIVNEVLDKGFKEYIWDGKNAEGHTVASGIYFYRLKMGKNVLTKKMVLLR